ncbi:oxidoreductase-like domain-containing protein [Methyloversatilis sp.]|uniref:oxidoreductase-like domain-containing protein n=1 Tax=Methyloversatilis sp. TaxID=2569862 RepID=UPI0035B3426E
MTEMLLAAPAVEDPAPVPPVMPMDSECCESGCERCVWTVYQEEKLAHERRYAAWLKRHPEACPAP